MTRQPLTPPPVTSVVLDMDGLLIDTEPVWRDAEAAVFAVLGVELTEAELIETTGLTIGEVVAAWRPRICDGQVPRLTDAGIADQITDRVVAHVRAAGHAMPGVPAAVRLFERLGLRLAIASSSPLRLIDAVCDRLGLQAISVRCSALGEARGKPAPDVYLTAARRLGAAPGGCLAIEDSPHGIAAAKAAGMRCLAVPDPLLATDPRYRDADMILPTLTLLDERVLHRLGVAT